MSLVKSLLSWLAFPVYVWQGVGVRLRAERLLPAEGPVIHHVPGKGEPVRLLVLGDSSAASVGIGQTDRGLAARLAARISMHTGRPVHWRASGFNSATSGQIRDHVVPNLAHEAANLIVLAVGTNDAKNFHTVGRFKREFGGLLYALRAKWPEAHIVWSPIVEMSKVPALPPLLGRVLEIRASLINRMGTRRDGRHAASDPRPFGILDRRLSCVRGRLWRVGRSPHRLFDGRRHAGRASTVSIITAIATSAIFQKSPRFLRPGRPSGLMM